MSSFVQRVLLGAIFACCASAANAVDFGRTTGSFAISPSGAATYTIPIWTPPGTNGVAPSISLTYNSQAGNGLLGMGWNLNAALAIERCNRTTQQDSAGAPVDLTINDRFCINGSRLRLGTGTYGAAGSVYYTEIADYSRITAFNTAGNGPEYFVVEARSGLKYEYGKDSSARVVLGPTALRWMLNKVYDRNGNNYVISYSNATGFAVPDVISWTPTYWGSTNYRYEAKFNYLSTPRTDEDSYIGKIAGFDVVNRNRLENIQIKSSGTVVRKYRFSYDTSAVSSRSRLTSAKECADDAETNCFLPLTFGYQAGQAGITPSATSGISTTSSLLAGKYDFSGDGKSDLLYASSGKWKVAFSTGSGFSAAVDTGISSSTIILVQRFLANHQDGLLVNVSGVWNYVGYDGSSFVSTSTGIAVPTGYISGGEPRATDNNGDGIADLVWAIGGNVMMRLNATAAGATVPNFGSAFIAAGFSVGQGNVQIIDAQKCPLERKCDINGDGRADLIAMVTSVTNCGMSGCTVTNTPYDLFANGAGYGAGLLSGPIGYTGIQFNDDRCIDRVPNTAPSTLQVSGCNSGTPTTITLPGSGVLLDWNGDGRTDILVNNGGFFGVYLSKGSLASPFSSLIPTTVPILSGSTYFAADVDGDGLDDLVCMGTTSPFSVSYYLRNGSGGVFLTQQADLLNSVTDGFGVNISPSYVSSSQSAYVRGMGTQFPLLDATAPIVVAAQVVSSDGVGGTYIKSYSYEGARYFAGRSEAPSFHRIGEVDSRNGLVTRTYFDQVFPVSGMVNQREVMQPNGVTTISRDALVNTFTPLDTTTNNQRYFAYTSSSTNTQYEVGGTFNGNLLRTIANTNLYETTGGALYDRTVTITEPASGANGVSAGGQWTARTYTPIANLLNDTTNWCLGRPGQIQQINSHNLSSYGVATTRTSNITWSASYCRPTQTLDEQGSSTLQVTTDIGYDTFGNVNSTTTTGVGMTARTTSATYSDATFTSGQFPLSGINALGQMSTMAWNYDLGVPLSVTDPNGLTTSWHHDFFGRRNSETRADGTSSSVVYGDCAVPGYCPGFIKTATTASDYDNAGAVVGRITTYQDSFGRTVQQFQRSRDWISTNTNVEFNALGQVYRTSAPCFASGTGCATQYWSSNTYDLIGRVTQVSRPISDTNPSLQTTTVYYEGLTTRIQDPQGKYSYKTGNAADQVARSQDHDNYYQGFEYDAFGGVKRVLDSAGSTLQSSIYNLRGVLTQRVDMDMGTWNFTPNALGETTSQTDAKSQATIFTYDLLGRLTTRIETEGTSTWTWGSSAGSHNIGRLSSVSGPGYSESYSYDSLARLSNTTISADTTYQIDYTYNSMGAFDTLTYPTSTSSYRLKLQYDYLYGHLHSIKDYNSPSTVYWTAIAGNPQDQIVQESLGNGLTASRTFDAITGLLRTIQAGASGGAGIQNLAYEWDQAGNLSSRKDINQSNLIESFSYDNLHRLTSSSLSTSGTNLSVSYDALGNIATKSDVGTYTYDAAKKHQVISTNNGWTFGYDSNGNMTTGRGATLTWTSYNYPATISNGADTSAFSYTPDRQYWKQVSNYTTGGAATTIYVGGLLEKVTTSGGTDYRHMIRAGNSTIIVSRQSSGTNSVSYVTSDHLGSSSAITNASGAVLVNSSFDAFGKRRGSNWTGTPSTGDWSAIASLTRHGYTEHTMLDNLGLTHMNGRVYDSMMGRFVSADPFITERGNTQNFNRYSYLDNNPLNATDSSGFGPDTGPFWSLGVGIGSGGSAPDWFVSILRETTWEVPDRGSLTDMNPSPQPGMTQEIDGWSAVNKCLGGGSALATAGSLCRKEDMQKVLGLVQKLTQDMEDQIYDAATKYIGPAGDFVADLSAKYSRELGARGTAIGTIATALDSNHAGRTLGLATMIPAGPEGLLVRGAARGVLANAARGSAAEARVLKDLGLAKNTSAVSTAEGRAIPDALTSSMSVEVKDAASVSLTRQLRIETEAARAAGRESVLVTGENTCVSGPCSRAFDTIIRRPDLGPQ